MIDQKKLLLDAIKSPSDMATCDKLVRAGYMIFTGNQHNPSWQWVRSQLANFDTEELEQIYTGDYSCILT